MDLVKISPQFALHGKYVGPGHTGGPALGTQNWNSKPIDALDNAARNHDWQYATQPGNRGAADALLSKRAFAALPSLKGLSKAKAALVGVGMGLMGLLGSRNRALLLDAPPVVSKSQQYAAKPNLALAYGSINKAMHSKQGNSSSRNQMKGIRKSGRPKTSGQKRAERQALTKALNLPKRAPRKSKALSPTTTNVQMTAQVSAPVIQSRPTFKKAYDTGMIAFEMPYDISYPANAPTGRVFFSLQLNRDFFAGTLLSKLFDIYERWEALKLGIELLLPAGTNTAGFFYTIADSDPNDVLTINNNIPTQFLTNHSGSLKHSLFGTAQMIWLPEKKRGLYSDDQFQSSTTTTVDDSRLTSAGIVAFVAGASMPSTAGTLCSFKVHIHAKFRIFSLTENSGSLACIKLQAGTGTTLTVNNTVFPMCSVINTIINSGTNTTVAYKEYAFQPWLFLSGNGASFGQICLPVGQYYCNFGLAISGTPGSTTFTLNAQAGAVFAHDWAQIVTTGFGAFEYSGTSPSGLVPFVNGLAQQGMLRVTQPSTASAFMLFSPSWTTTNTVAVTGVYCIIQRMTSVITAPYAAPFPLGTTAYVAVTTPAPSEPVVTPLAPLVRPKHVALNNKEYQDFLDFQEQKKRFERLPIVLEQEDEKSPVVTISRDAAGPSRWTYLFEPQTRCLTK